MTFVGYGGISVRRQGVQGLHVHVGMPSAADCWRCLEAITPWLPVVLALSANSPWFAGDADRHGVEPRAGARRAAARGRAAGVLVVRRMGVVGRAARPARRGRGLHAHLVGRASASEARDARGADRRPADGRRAVVGVRGAPAGDVRDRARRWTAGRRDARRPRARRLRAEPLGGRTLRARAASCCIRPATASSRRPSSAPSCSTLVTPAARALGGADALARIDPAACEADLQLQSEQRGRRGGRPRGADARLTCAHGHGHRDDPGQRHPLREVRACGSRRRSREPTASSPRTRT